MKTRNIITTLFLLFIGTIYTNCNAQDATKNPARFGFKAGINFSNLYTNNVDSNDLLVGFNGGLFAKLPITSFFAIQPEIYFTTKGSRVAYKNTFVNGVALFNLNYIEIPVLAVINVSKNFNVHFGPYISYLIDGKVKNDSKASIFDFENNVKPDDYNRIDAGLAAGLGVDFGAFGLGLRYNYGLTTVGKERTFLGTTTYTFPDAKNSVLSLYASFSLN